MKLRAVLSVVYSCLLFSHYIRVQPLGFSGLKSHRIVIHFLLFYLLVFGFLLHSELLHGFLPGQSVLLGKVLCASLKAACRCCRPSATLTGPLIKSACQSLQSTRENASKHLPEGFAVLRHLRHLSAIGVNGVLWSLWARERRKYSLEDTAHNAGLLVGASVSAGLRGRCH